MSDPILFAKPHSRGHYLIISDPSHILEHGISAEEVEDKLASLNHGVRNRLIERLKAAEEAGVFGAATDAIGDALGLSADARTKLEKALAALGRDTLKEELLAQLPDGPMRQPEPRENILDYLRSADGFGPWLEAEVLTRPLLNQMSPRAYTALTYYLRRKQLPDDIVIPTFSEALGRASIDTMEVREAQRVVSRASRRRAAVRKLQR